MRKIFIVLLTAFMFVLAGCTYSDSSDSNNYEDRITSLEWENEELQDRVDELEAEVEELQGFMWDVQNGLYGGY